LFSAQLRDSSIMSGRYLPGVTPVGGRKSLPSTVTVFSASYRACVPLRNYRTNKSGQ
jgi:hypothetical protein